MNASKQRTPRPPHAAPTPTLEPGLQNRPWTRRLIGLAILWHIVAVAVAPMAFSVRGRDVLPGGGPARPGAATVAEPPEAAARPIVDSRDHVPIVRLGKLFRPYLNLLYLNHAYRFFAPEPGPSYVMEYEVHRKAGPAVRGRLPDREEHWPRLLYHRYFMLATQNPRLMSHPLAVQAVQDGSSETLAHAILRHLVRREGGERGVLRLYLHRLLWPEEVLGGKSPSDRETFLPEGQIVYPPPASALAPRTSAPQATQPEEIRP